MAERELYEWDGEKYVPDKGTPGADTIYWNGARWVPGKNPEGPNAFMRGLATGWEGIKDIPAVGYAMAQGALGDEQGSKDTLGAIKEKTEQNLAGGYQTRYTLEDVKKDPTKLGGWAAEQMGGAAASIGFGVAAALATGAALPAVGAGAVGTVATGAAARFGLGRMAAAAVQRGQAAAIAEAAQTGTAITAEQAAAQAIQGIGRNVAMTGAVGLASGAQNIPESFTTIFDETGQIRPGVAFSVGALKSSLDVLPITRLMARTRGPEFADRLTNLISARLASKYPGATGALAGSLESLAYEGLTEGAQALLDQTAMNIIADKSIDWENVIENAAGGGVGSMPFGAAAGFRGGRRARARGPRPAQETPPPGETPPGTTGEVTPPPPVTPTGEATVTPAGEAAPTVTPAGEGAITPTGEVVPGGEAAPTVTPAGEGAPAVTPAGEAAPTDLDRLRAVLPQPGAEGIRRIMGAKWASDILGREVTPDEARQFFGELQKEGRVVPRGPGFMVPFKEVPLIDHLTSVVDSNEERHGQRFITIDQLRENLPEGADLAQMQDIVGQLGSQGVQITESAPAAGRVPALQQRLDEVLPQYKGQPAAGVFQTEKGSIYLTHDDGTTTRHKEAREDVGHEGDFGWKERTQKTVYVDPLMVGGLSAAGLQGVGSRGARLLIKDGKATLALWNDATNKWGITPSLANVPVYDKPAPGLAPLELWNKKDDVPAGFEGYASQHAGNKIVAMGPAPAIAPTEVTPTAEVTPAAEVTPTTTPAQEVAPQWQEMPAGADTMRTEKIKDSATLLKDAKELWQGRTSFGQGLKSLLDMLTTETNRTTKEHAFALAGGEVVTFFSTNNKGMVRISDNRALATRMNDSGESFLLTHSHPSNTSFSVGDAASFGDSPGEKISVVRGNKGFTAFMVRPDFMWTQRYGGLLAKAGRAAKKMAVDMVYKDPAVQGTREQKFLAYTRLQNLALARLGLIRYTDTAPLSDLDFVPDWRAKIEKISKSMVAQNLKNQPSTQKAFADGSQYLDEHNRLAGSLGEPGGIERILQGPQAGAAGATQAGRPAGMARPAPTAPRTGAARSEARLSEALDRANDIAGEIEGWREGLSAQQEKEHRRHYASLTSEERTDPRAKLLKKLLDYIDGTLKADQYALLAEVEATTDNYHPSVRAPREPKFAKTRKQPSIKISPRTLEEADYYQDNPAVSRGNTEWLLEKQRDADAWYRTTKGMNGAITAKFRNPVDLPVSVVSQVPGERDEQRKPGEPQFDRLLKKVRKEGWKPDPIDIYVNHRGEAFIYEGNTRAAVAKYLGIDTIPVYVGWLNGAEMVEGKWTPKNVLNMYPSEKAIVEPVRMPAAVAADVQQFQAINEQANTMLDEVSIPFSCRVKK